MHAAMARSNLHREQARGGRSSYSTPTRAQLGAAVGQNIAGAPIPEAISVGHPRWHLSSHCTVAGGQALSYQLPPTSVRYPAMCPMPGTMPDFGVINESDIEWGRRVCYFIVFTLKTGYFGAIFSNAESGASLLSAICGRAPGARCK